jgi:pimeloyl-ACP methyl ester carboxylesterase
LRTITVAAVALRNRIADSQAEGAGTPRGALVVVLALATVLIAGCARESGSPEITGTWEGRLAFPGLEIRMGLIVEHASDGALIATLVRPDHGDRLDVDRIEWSGGQLRFHIDSIGAEYAGALDEAGDLHGRWSQHNRSLPVRFRRVQELAAPVRPQTPRPPFPYKSEEVSFESRAGGIRLAGTLTVPEAVTDPGTPVLPEALGRSHTTAPRGPGGLASAVASGTGVPAVILVPGVGAHGRDYVVLGHRRFLLLADYLTRRGVAVLRYDGRGVGASAGVHEGTAAPDLALDVLGGVNFLRSRPGIDPGRVGILGHSDGGTIALLAASRDSAVAFIVTLGSPGLAGRDYNLQYEASVWKAMGLPPSVIATKRRTQERILDLVAGEADSSWACAALQGILSELRPPLPEERKEAALRRFLSPWFRFSIRHDPAGTIREVRCPILAIFGEKDVQVPPQGNFEAMRSAIGAMPPASRRASEVVVLPNLNHFFQTARTGTPDEYGTIEETLAPSAMEQIAGWMRERIGASALTDDAGLR